MAKAPYTFPHKSRADIIDYIMGHNGRSYHYRNYKFVWNVKAHDAKFDGDSLRKHNRDLDPAFDAAWQEHLDRNPELFNRFCEDASRYLTDGEWTSYPGEDQGDWEFGFEGRSGGWLVLLKWRGHDLRDLYSDADEAAEYKRARYDLQDGGCNLDNWPWERLKAFYRGLRTAESDFTPAKASAEVEYQAASYREDWEDGKRAERDAAIAAYVAEMEAARPDMAQA